MDFIIIVIIVVTLYLAFGIGSNDETMSSVVGSGTLSLNKATIWGGILVCLGTIFLSEGVGKNIGSSLLAGDLLDEYNVAMMLSIILGTSTWLVVASRTGAPISTTHSVVGSVLGIAFIWSFIPGNDFLYAINWTKLGTIALGWVLSPLLGGITAYIMQKHLQTVVRKKWKRDGRIGFLEIEKTEKRFEYLLLVFIFISQVSRGGNDSANAIGIYYGLVETGEISANISIILRVLTGVLIAAGLMTVGRTVIKNVGGSLIEMRPSDALAIESATAIVIFGCTALSLPISGSHVLIFAIIGGGLVKGEKPNWKALRQMVKSWILTFPVAGAMSGAFYLLSLAVF